MSNEIQKDEVILPGGIGTVKMGDKEGEITKIFSNKKDGSVTLTVDPLKQAEEFWKDMKVVEQSVGSFKTKDGSEIGYSSTTFKKDSPKTENAEFEIIDNSNCVFNVKQIEDRMKELGYLEDIDHEIIEPNRLEDKNYGNNSIDKR